MFATIAVWPRTTQTETYSNDVITRASRLHALLTGGMPLLPDNLNYISVLNSVQGGDLNGAAKTIVDKTLGSREVYDVALSSITRPFNRNQSLGPIVPSNGGGAAIGGTDIDALFVGLARDRQPISQFVTNDVVYYSKAITNNGDDYVTYFTQGQGNHYVRAWLEQSPRDTLEATNRPQFQGVGVLNSQTWGLNYLQMGTNRRTIYGILNNLYCVNQSQIQNTQVPDIFVGTDIDRSDPHYQDTCRGCHAQMDAWVRIAYAEYDYPPAGQNGGVIYNGVRRNKANEYHSPFFDLTTPEGATFWLFFNADTNNRVFGFHAVSSGNANIPVQNYGDTGFQYMTGTQLSDLGQIIAASDGYYQCLVKRLITLVLLKKPLSLVDMSQADWNTLAAESAFIASESAALRQSQDIVKAFSDVAVQYIDR